MTLFLKKNRVTTSLDVAATCQCHVTICLRDILPMSHLHLHDIPPHVTDTGHKACFMPGVITRICMDGSLRYDAED